MDSDATRTPPTEAATQDVPVPHDPDPARAEAQAVVRSVHDLEVDPPAPQRPE